MHADHLPILVQLMKSYIVSFKAEISQLRLLTTTMVYPRLPSIYARKAFVKFRRTEAVLLSIVIFTDMQRNAAVSYTATTLMTMKLRCFCLFIYLTQYIFFHRHKSFSSPSWWVLIRPTLISPLVISPFAICTWKIRRRESARRALDGWPFTRRLEFYTGTYKVINYKN